MTPRTLRMAWIAALGYAMSPAGITSEAPARRAAGAPLNVVFIMSDDSGYQDIAPYGAPTILTPNLDRLESEGVKLTDFYASGPVCSPNRAAFVTGRYQTRSGMERNSLASNTLGLDVAETSIAQMFNANGLTASRRPESSSCGTADCSTSGRILSQDRWYG